MPRHSAPLPMLFGCGQPVKIYRHKCQNKLPPVIPVNRKLGRPIWNPSCPSHPLKQATQVRGSMRKRSITQRIPATPISSSSATGRNTLVGPASSSLTPSAQSRHGLPIRSISTNGGPTGRKTLASAGGASGCGPEPPIVCVTYFN